MYCIDLLIYTIGNLLVFFSMWIKWMIKHTKVVLPIEA